MERLIKRIESNAKLTTSVRECETHVTPILQKFITNFPEYTDHSIVHSKSVLYYVAEVLGTELDKLNDDEVYILIMAGFLHDIGMCPTIEMKQSIIESDSFKGSKKSFEDYLRWAHHDISYKYITCHWKSLKIVNETYAEAIGLVGMGHRVVDLFNFEQFVPDFPVKSGSEYVCLPYLAGILRVADELDITNDRTPELLYNEYFPENRISKEEWEKHKANYFVNFKIDTIKISSKCFKKEIYYALLKQYKKIESVINLVQKLIRAIPQNQRELQLHFLKLEYDIKTVGFIPKEIGFSFDLQNTIDTFIGDNIYNNKDVAIRECLQNSIDTCRYRKQLDKEYEPQIEIHLSGTCLSIDDNGLGMDEFIVENYFAKLAKSYYQENKVKNEFEAISQFGVGVFSYFLICDNFVVESKREGKEGLKFKVNKDADSYFYFFDETDRKLPGTSITFFLRDEISFDTLVNQVKEYIRFVEIPIHIHCKERKETVVTQDFKLDIARELKGLLPHSKVDVLPRLTIVDFEVSNGECEGIIGFVVETKGSVYSPSSLFRNSTSYQGSFIELSHKGIYVNNIHDDNFRGVIGKLNLKKKKNIDIGRYHIKNRENVNAALGEFYPNLLNKLLINWKKKKKLTKVNLSREFLRNYLNYEIDGLSQGVLNSFRKLLYFTIYNGSGNKHFNLEGLDSFKEIVIISDNRPYVRGSVYDFKDIDDIYRHLKKPLLLEEDDNIANKILSIFRMLNRGIEIVALPFHWYFVVKAHYPGNEFRKQLILNGRHEGLVFNKPHIICFPHLDHATPFNLNHEIVKYFQTKIEMISKSQELTELSKELLSLLHDFVFDFHIGGIKKPTDRVIKMNNILSEINQSMSTKFTLSPTDFPEWMNVKINWKKVYSSQGQRLLSSGNYKSSL